MNRKDFLKSIGFGVLGISVVTLMQDCSNNVASSQSVDFTINLNDSAYAGLKIVGGSATKDNVVIARTSSTSFAAVSKICTHQGNPVGYTGSIFYCPSHGSSFSQSGQKLSGPATSNLQSFNTTFNDPMLRVKS